MRNERHDADATIIPNTREELYIAVPVTDENHKDIVSIFYDPIVAFVIETTKVITNHDLLHTSHPIGISDSYQSSEGVVVYDKKRDEWIDTSLQINGNGMDGLIKHWKEYGSQ